MKRIFTIITLTLLLSCSSLFAQYTLKGTILDAESLTPVPNAPIKISCLNEIVFADANGSFEINISKDSCMVEISSMMYQTMQRVIIFSPQKRTIKVKINLEPLSTVLGEAKVSTRKYNNDPTTATVSVVSITPKEKENRNYVTMDNLINTISGIVIVDNEPQIRGGSGYSSGMGSRVMIMLDDMPLLRPDANRPMWDFIPMESVEQVDVIKGASSVLFGSSALTGAINVLTAYPRSKPTTAITVFAGLYDDPRNPFKTSWHHKNPYQAGISFLHSRVIKKNFDFVIGGEVLNDQSYIGTDKRVSLTRNTDENTSGKYDTRYRLNFSTRYRFEKVKGLSVSLNGNFMYSENAQSYIWFDADTNTYRSYEGSLSYYKDFTFYVDPVIKYATKKAGSHTFRNRILYCNSNEMTGAQSSRSTMYFDEYQYNLFLKRIGLNIAAGVSNILTTSFGPVFSGEMPSNEYLGTIETVESMVYSDNLAFYTQLEYKMLKKRNLTFQLGGRWELIKLWGKTIEAEVLDQPIFRAGVNYQIMKSHTTFRASVGQGYRFPSIGEKFISITIGDYGFYPNPDLVPETSTNFEVGVMQPFKLFDFQGIFDIAYFHQEFKNFIEFCLGPWGNSGAFHQRLGYKFINIGPARVNGIDFSMMGKGKISTNVDYNLNLSYTWSNPVTKDRHYVYYSYGIKDYDFVNSCYDTTRSVLKYRIEHMAKMDLEFVFYKHFAAGVTMSYYSPMKNVDKFLFEYDAENPDLPELRRNILRNMGNLPFSGFYNYYQNNQKGSLVFDAHISYNFNKTTLSFIVKNIFNKEYSLRPLYTEPTRTFTLQLSCKF